MRKVSDRCKVNKGWIFSTFTALTSHRIILIFLTYVVLNLSYILKIDTLNTYSGLHLHTNDKTSKTYSDIVLNFYRSNKIILILLTFYHFVFNLKTKSLN